MNPCLIFDLKVMDHSLDYKNPARIYFVVTQDNQDAIKLLLPNIDLSEVPSLFNMTYNVINNVNKKFKEIIKKSQMVKLITEPRMTKKSELYLMLTHTLILP
jgi:hypothetical protein